MPSVGAGVWGILGSLPEDVLREEVEPVVEPPGLGPWFVAKTTSRASRTLGPSVIRYRMYSVVARSGSASRHAHPPFCSA
jgi:hypothetical protein